MAGAFGAEFYQYVPLPLGGGGGRGEGESQSARFTVILRAEPVFRGASLRALQGQIDPGIHGLAVALIA